MEGSSRGIILCARLFRGREGVLALRSQISVVPIVLIRSAPRRFGMWHIILNFRSVVFLAGQVVLLLLTRFLSLHRAVLSAFLRSPMELESTDYGFVPFPSRHSLIRTRQSRTDLSMDIRTTDNDLKPCGSSYAVTKHHQPSLQPSLGYIAHLSKVVRPSLFYSEANTCRNRSGVWD